MINLPIPLFESSQFAKRATAAAALEMSICLNVRHHTKLKLKTTLEGFELGEKGIFVEDLSVDHKRIRSGEITIFFICLPIFECMYE